MDVLVSNRCIGFDGYTGLVGRLRAGTPAKGKGELATPPARELEARIN